MGCSYIDTENKAVKRPALMKMLIASVFILLSTLCFSAKSFATPTIDCSGAHQLENFQIQDISIPVSAINIEAGKHLPVGTVIYRQHFQPEVIPAFNWRCHSSDENQSAFFVTTRASWLLDSSPNGTTISGLFPSMFQTNIPGVGVSIVVTDAMIDYNTALPGFVDNIASTVCHKLENGHCNGAISPVNKGIELVLIKIAPIPLEEDNIVLASSFPSFMLEVEIVESLITAQYAKLRFSGQIMLSELAQ